MTGPNGLVAHFGIQGKSTEAVGKIAERLRDASLETAVEENVTCCYAVQNKVWATDLDENKWEVYVVPDHEGRQHHCSSACCPEMPAIMEAVQRGDLTAAKSAFEKAVGMAACGGLATPAQ